MYFFGNKIGWHLVDENGVYSLHIDEFVLTVFLIIMMLINASIYWQNIIPYFITQ
jgi:hypothetical protein